MRSRIRYVESKLEPGILYSRGHISSKYGTRYDIIIDTNKFSFEIRNVTSNRIVKKGRVNPNTTYALNYLKLKAKKSLFNLKIEFKTEIRSCQN